MFKFATIFTWKPAKWLSSSKYTAVSRDAFEVSVDHSTSFHAFEARDSSAPPSAATSFPSMSSVTTPEISPLPTPFECPCLFRAESSISTIDSIPHCLRTESDDDLSVADDCPPILDNYGSSILDQCCSVPEEPPSISRVCASDLEDGSSLIDDCPNISIPAERVTFLDQHPLPIGLEAKYLVTELTESTSTNEKWSGVHFIAFNRTTGSKYVVERLEKDGKQPAWSRHWIATYEDGSFAFRDNPGRRGPGSTQLAIKVKEGFDSVVIEHVWMPTRLWEFPGDIYHTAHDVFIVATYDHARRNHWIPDPRYSRAALAALMNPTRSKEKPE